MGCGPCPPRTDRILFLPAGQRVPEKILFLLRSCAAVTDGAVMNSGNQHVWPFARPQRRECSTIRAPSRSWDGMAGTAGLYFSSYLLSAPS